MNSIAINPGKEAYIPHFIEIERKTAELFPPALLPDTVRGKRLQPNLFTKAVADALLGMMTDGDF